MWDHRRLHRLAIWRPAAPPWGLRRGGQDPEQRSGRRASCPAKPVNWLKSRSRRRAKRDQQERLRRAARAAPRCRRLIALLANPNSGSGEADEVERCCVRGASGRRPRPIAGVVAPAAPERVIVAGGDGSVGCARGRRGAHEVPLGVVAVGTANDFARALELPRDLAEAVELAATGTRTSASTSAGSASRPFVNAASAGLSPVAARKAHGLKRFLGRSPTPSARCGPGCSRKPVECPRRTSTASAVRGRRLAGDRRAHRRLRRRRRDRRRSRGRASRRGRDRGGLTRSTRSAAATACERERLRARVGSHYRKRLNDRNHTRARGTRVQRRRRAHLRCAA